MKYLVFILILLLCACGCKTSKNDITIKKMSIDIENSFDTTYSYEDTQVLRSTETASLENDRIVTSPELNIKDVSKPISKKLLAKLKPDITIGKVLYQVPDTMTIYTNYRVTVRIINDTINTIISENLSGKANTAKIPVSSKMEVALIDESPEDDKSFKLTKITDNQQSIDDDEYTEWIFNVQPIKTGNKTLNLVISVIKGDLKKQVVYTDTIHVKANVKKEVSSFWKKYWQYLLSTLIIPFGVYLWQKRKKS